MANDEHIVRYTREDVPRGKTDWERVRNLTDEEIERAIREGPDAAPILDEDWFRQAELMIPPHLKHPWVQIDDDLMAWFRSQGEDWPAHINKALRAHVEQRAKTRRKAG